MADNFEVRQLKPDQKLAKSVKLIKDELDDFFQCDFPLPAVCFLPSRQFINKMQGRETEDWLVGWTQNQVIFILHPAKYEQESCHSADDFLRSLKHEFAHIYFRSIAKTSLPVWLNEGLACYLAGQPKKKALSAGDIAVALNLFNRHDKKVYFIGCALVDLLLERFGKKNLLKLLRRLNPQIDKKSFSRLFKEIYGANFNWREITKQKADY